jgi:hypothetical protein
MGWRHVGRAATPLGTKEAHDRVSGRGDEDRGDGRVAWSAPLPRDYDDCVGAVTDVPPGARRPGLAARGPRADGPAYRTARCLTGTADEAMRSEE